MMFVAIGVALVYISSVVMVLIYLRERRKLMWFDWVIAFVPVVRVIRLSLEIEVDE